MVGSLLWRYDEGHRKGIFVGQAGFDKAGIGQLDFDPRAVQIRAQALRQGHNPCF
jgi:hypothetical protein